MLVFVLFLAHKMSHRRTFFASFFYVLSSYVFSSYFIICIIGVGITRAHIPHSIHALLKKCMRVCGVLNAFLSLAFPISRPLTLPASRSMHRWKALRFPFIFHFCVFLIVDRRFVRKLLSTFSSSEAQVFTVVRICLKICIQFSFFPLALFPLCVYLYDYGYWILLACRFSFLS